MLGLRLADGEVLVDKTVAAHEHVKGPAEEVSKSICDESLGLARPRGVEGPKHLTALSNGRDTHAAGHIRKGIVDLALGAEDYEAMPETLEVVGPQK
jgi:hypothetical protein